jgi:hypothetical protein
MSLCSCQDTRCQAETHRDSRRRMHSESEANEQRWSLTWSARKASAVRPPLPVLAELCLRRAGPPALRPGHGLRRPGLRPWTEAPLGCAAEHREPSRTGGHQTAPAWSRSSGGALHLDQASAARPSEACSTGCRPSREPPEPWEKSGRRSCEEPAPALPQTNNDQRLGQGIYPDAHVSGPACLVHTEEVTGSIPVSPTVYVRRSLARYPEVG